MDRFFARKWVSLAVMLNVFSKLQCMRTHALSIDGAPAHIPTSRAPGAGVNAFLQVLVHSDCSASCPASLAPFSGNDNGGVVESPSDRSIHQRIVITSSTMTKIAPSAAHDFFGPCNETQFFKCDRCPTACLNTSVCHGSSICPCNFPRVQKMNHVSDHCAADNNPSEDMATWPPQLRAPQNTWKHHNAKFPNSFLQRYPGLIKKRLICICFHATVILT